MPHETAVAVVLSNKFTISSNLKAPPFATKGTFTKSLTFKYKSKSNPDFVPS